MYDEETGLYYLQSRYYNPLMCRFISPDYILATAGGIPDKSAYAYCQNNPICAIDADGEWSNWLTGLMTVVAAAVTIVAVVAAAPAAACAATVSLIVAGVSSTTAATLAAVGTAAVATVAISASVDAAVTATTGFSPVRDGLLGGKHDDLYEDFQVAGAICTAGISTMAAMSPGTCFVEGTLIKSEDGQTPIEDICVGNLVWAENPETGEKALKPVKQVFVKETTELVHLCIKGEKIITTPTHPFYVPNIGWIEAKHLSIGCKLLLSSGEVCSLDSSYYERLVEPIKVFNFEVEDLHTYYVGTIGVLVHNTCGDRNHTKPSQVAKEMGYSKEPERSHGQAVYYKNTAPKPLRYISYDIDSHNGGYWKAASSPQNLLHKSTRSGTYDMYLQNRIGD